MANRRRDPELYFAAPRGAALLVLALLAVISPLLAQQPAGSPSTPTQSAPAPGPGPQQPTTPPTPSTTPPPAAQSQTQPGAGATRNPDGTYTIRRTTRLVVLDVVVTDPKGNVVRDLKKEDFHVTELGQPEDILNFEETGTRTPDASLTIDSTADLDRLAPRAPINIILLDEFNTRFEDMAFARYSLRKYLEKQPDRLTTPTMLIAVSLQKFEVLRDYTQNKQAVLDALDHHFAAYPWQVHQYAWVAERYGTAFGTLMRVAQATVGHPGHKNMIWIGRGFPSFNFANAPVDSQNRVDSAVQECVNMLRDARVTLYTIDPAGVMMDPGIYGSQTLIGGGAASSFATDPFGGNYQFNKLATATGGRALYGRNDVDAEIGTTIRDGASFYTLTYRPGSNDNPQRFRRIKITVDRPGLNATSREGYYLQRGPGRVDPVNPSRRLAFDLMSAESSTMVYDGVPITVTPSASTPDAYLLHVDARGLNWTYATDTEPRHAEIVVMTALFDKKGKELKRDAKVMKAVAPPGSPPAGRIERAIETTVKLDHDPKAVRARIVVRVTASGRIGTADINLLAPAAVSSAPPPA